MDYEKKYREALERMKSWARGEHPECFTEAQKAAEFIFPELKESEDEKIRKELLAYCKNRAEKYHNDPKYKNISAWIAWLEKQGEQKPTIIIPKFRVGDEIKTAPKTVNEESLTITKIDEKGYWSEDLFICSFEDSAKWELVGKLIDNVEPKFKNGQWIVWQDKCYKVNYNGCGYELVDQNGLNTSLEYGTIDENAHLWTIQDAQDGDVLVTDSGRPFIFKGCLDKDHPNSPVAYCGINSMNEFFVSEGINWWTDKNVYPATKEQRELLFKKMKEAGYEWDYEKKELKKIEQNSAFGEEDEKIFNYLLWFYDTRFRWNDTCCDGIKFGDIVTFLKSLKDRYAWKPSDEQMKFLWKYAEQNNCDGSILTSLYNDLKKLKG